MILSISCRIAESFLSKEVASLTFEEFADVAVAAGYDAVCMRASQIGIQSSPEQVQRARQILDERKLKVTMISGDFDIVYNNERGPNCLYNVGPYLDLAEALGAKLIRVCIKKPEDLVQARHAAEQAAARGLIAGISTVEHPAAKAVETFAGNGSAQAFDPGEMVGRRGVRDTGAGCAFAQAQRIEPAFGQQFDPGFDQRRAQIAVMVAGFVL